jgi:hypothetical protein
MEHSVYANPLVFVEHECLRFLTINPKINATIIVCCIHSKHKVSGANLEIYLRIDKLCEVNKIIIYYN